MVKRKYVVGVSSLTIILVLVGSLFYYSMVQAQDLKDYDPWADINADGTINMRDISYVAIKFGSSGTPINKAAVQFEGNISVPAAAFTPESHDVSYDKWGANALANTGSDYATFRAAVQLPHGATVTKVTFYYRDYGIDQIQLGLSRCQENIGSSMASVLTPTTPYGDFVSYDYTINYATVDNNNYAYYLYVYLPWSSLLPYDYVFKLARIEWEYQ